jgi:hypothetical protein
MSRICRPAPEKKQPLPVKTGGRLLFCLYREKWDEEMGRPEELEAEYFQLFTGRTLFDDLSQKKNPSAFCFDLEKEEAAVDSPNLFWNSTNFLQNSSKRRMEYFQLPLFFYQLPRILPSSPVFLPTFRRILSTFQRIGRFR